MPVEENSEDKFRLGKSERRSRQMAKLKYNPHLRLRRARLRQRSVPIGFIC